MDLKMAMALFLTLLFVIFFIYDLFKEKTRARKQKRDNEEQKFFQEAIQEQLIENSLTNKEILKYLKFSMQKYAEEITESQVRIVIDSILSNSQSEMYNYVTKIIRENHIKGNEKEVTSKIKLFINNRLHKDSLLLKEFKYKEKNLGEIPANEWKEYLIENMLSSVLKEKGEKSLSSSLQNSYDSFKYDMLDKTLS
jgi:hypothetical protein